MRRRLDWAEAWIGVVLLAGRLVVAPVAAAAVGVWVWLAGQELAPGRASAVWGQVSGPVGIRAVLVAVLVWHGVSLMIWTTHRGVAHLLECQRSRRWGRRWARLEPQWSRRYR